jgi:uncharacterized protein with ParB-like and HNH nuclease domain
MAGATITSQTFPLKRLFQEATYRIDYYQREYAWSADDVRTLVNDLLDQFRVVWRDGRYNRRNQTEPFFLGPFVYSEEQRGVRFLVDGQQRFTTLHLIFIHLRNLARAFRKQDAVENLGRVIVDFDNGRRRFRVDIDERKEALTALYDRKRYEPPPNASLSLRNLWSRSDQIASLLDAEISGEMCPYFVDWLLEQVVLVGIQAPNRDSGYRIFESMNDRGARLTAVDLVKSFLLSNVGSGEEELNKAWRNMLAEITTIRDDADAPKKFLKAVLVGRYSEGNEQNDGDVREIDSALNIWVRKNRERRLHLHRADDYLQFVNDLIQLSKHYVTFLRASRRPQAEHGLSALFYNEVNGLTNQMHLILAAIRPGDVLTEAKQKAALVANYLDRLFVLRALNEEPVKANDFEPDIRRLIPVLRGCATSVDVAKVLAVEMAEDGFESIVTFGLRGNNKAEVRYILTRLTAYTELGCGKRDLSDEYLADERTWHIEHLWPNHYELARADVPDELTFRLLRSRLGGLALLHQRDNTSLKDLPFAGKLGVYARQNNLLAVLSPGHRKNNPFARDFARDNDVAAYFRDFGAAPDISTVVKGRAELYRRLAVRIWDPQALGFPAQPSSKVATDEEGPEVQSVPEAHRTVAKPKRKLTTDVARMVREGIIAPGSRIVLTHNNTDHFAVIDGDGYITFSMGDSFSKLDEAGKVITQKRCDGLGEWFMVMPDGARLTIRELRNRARLR